jgi:hypothetical protein
MWSPAHLEITVQTAGDEAQKLSEGYRLTAEVIAAPAPLFPAHENISFHHVPVEAEPVVSVASESVDTSELG